MIANSTTTSISIGITKFVNQFRYKSWNKAIDFISCFFSAGSMIAGFLDWFSDKKFDGKIRM